ncbi:hypothetical protein NPIL_318191 [Nephila pilipes]|uniref:Uncharacterized protein n=1 Tax=Nephila pilipes TaxID=299642 RepID=A0A8X6N9W2_NEPPI|nr:hypothetical protein NPIL_318191 [Nephila pilipes]
MISSGIGDQPVNKKDLMRERFEYLLKKHWTKGRGSWTIEELTVPVTDAKSDVIFYCTSDMLFDILYKTHASISGRDRLFVNNKALHSGIKRTPYESLFGCAPRVGLPTISIPSEMFDAAEDEYQFENASTALTLCSESEDDAVIVKEISLNETVEVPFGCYEDKPPE